MGCGKSDHCAVLPIAGTKAGGPEYLQNFLIPRVITENCLRHGFAGLEE